jgi:predicted aldo/keto reductase-like oxidoreductase
MACDDARAPSRDLTRRDFLKIAAAGTLLGGFGVLEASEAASASGLIAKRKLGRTGLEVSIIGVGGWHLGVPSDPEEAVRIVRTAIDEGVNFMDNASCYNEGQSERIMGRALLDGYRDRVVLMTKNHGRDAATFRQQLEQSLKQLQTDRIDVLQFHEIIREGEPERIFSTGALEAAAKAREEGKIRLIGFTGHRLPRLLREMLEHEFPWDTVQLPVNLLDAHFRSFAKEIIPLASKRGLGIIGMKSLASGDILRTGVSPGEAIGYCLSQPIHTLVCGMDSLKVLRQDLEIARSWQPLGDEEQQRLLDRVAPHAREGRLEWYKVRRVSAAVGLGSPPDSRRHGTS